MTAIRFHQTNERIEGREGVAAFLEKQGVPFETWDVSRVQGPLKEDYSLTPEQQQAIIDLFAEEIAALSAKHGYRSQDIVVLSDATPRLDELLEQFKKEHHHAEDEVRFVIDGRGIFTLKGKDGRYFDVELEPGDLLSVPRGTRHWFTLTDERKIKCIRIFQSVEGWAAIYDESAGA